MTRFALWLAVILFAGMVLLAAGGAFAQDCRTPDEAAKMMHDSGKRVLGVRFIPFTGPALFYENEGLVFAAPIVDGCVEPVAGRVGPFDKRAEA